MQADLAVSTHGLTKRFGEILAVDHLNLEVVKGHIFGLVGPDGAGKTTTIRMLCGIIQPTEGTATVAGQDVVRYSERVKERIGYMSQRFSLYGDLTVRENILLFADLFGVPARQREPRIKALLAFSRLEPFLDRRAEFLSGGMKQKLALCCTLIHEPEILFLDEPTTGVDPVSRREFWKILYGLLVRGVTIFVSTPYMDEAERCNTVAFMSQGRILATGTPDELKAAIDKQVLAVRGTPRKVTRQVVLGTPGIEDLQTMGDVLHLIVHDADAVASELERALKAQNVEIHTLKKVKPSMEDVFLQLNVSTFNVQR